MTTQTDREDDRFGLASAVQKFIAPVLSATGFELREIAPFALIFESAYVELSISYDPYSFEIEVGFARKAELSRRFCLRDLLDAELGLGHPEQNFFQASSPEKIAWCVNAIANILRERGNSILSGSEEAFRRIASIAETRDEKDTKKFVNRPVREAAERAWRQRDYDSVRHLYESIESDLISVEKAKLEFARSRSSI